MDSGFPLGLLFNEARQGIVRGGLQFHHSKGSPEECLLAAHAFTAPKLAANLIHSTGNRNGAALQELRRARARRIAERTARQRALAHRRQSVVSRVSATISTAAARDQQYLHRLDRQCDGTERRLQELLFECLGEAAKARGRARLRSEQLALEVNKELLECQRAWRWSLFGARFDEENPSLTLTALEPGCGDFNENARFLAALLSPWLPTEHLDARRVPRITRLGEVHLLNGRPSRRQRDHMNIVGAPSRDPVELVDQLRRSGRPEPPRTSSSTGRRYPPGTMAVPKFDNSLLLSSRMVAWLLTDFNLVNNRIYYRLGEFSRTRTSGLSVTDIIPSLYSSTPPSSRDAPLRFEVAAALSTHRSTDSDAAQAYPDVLEARSGESSVFHFAAASLEHLMEVQAGGATPGSAPVQNLFVPVMTSSATKGAWAGVELVPLSPQVLRELYSVYLSREPASELTEPNGAVAVFPSAPTDDKYYCVVQNPVLPQRLSGPAATTTAVAILVEFDFSDVKEAPSPSPDDTSSSSKWDSALLGNFCRWRSCLRPASMLPAPRSLCVHHAHLKQFLDARTPKGKPSETGRFLPKRPPATKRTSPPTTSDDLALLKAASSLLQELVSGKLAATIDAFCQRACGDSSDRLWREHLVGGEPPRPPSWSQWANADPRAAMAAIDIKSEAHAALLDAERAATYELVRLAELGVYPTAELALIFRRDNAAAESPEGLEVGQRKAALLRLRREAAERDGVGELGIVTDSSPWQSNRY